MSEENEEIEEEVEQEDGKPSGKIFTQEQVSELMAKEKSQGVRRGRKEVLEKLGFETMEDVEAFRQQLRDAEAAQLSEVERAKREAEEARKEAQRQREEAQSERIAAKLERSLLTAGVPDAQVAKVARLVVLDTSTPEDDEITAAVADLKAEMPQLFKSPESQDPPPPHGDPGKAPGTKPGSDPQQKVRDRLKARHGDRLKSTS